MNVKKILVSQPKPTSDKSPYFEIAEKYGVEIEFRPFIKVEGLTAKEFRQSKITITDFTAIIFTARTAIDHFFRLCDEMRVTIPDTMKYFCTTESIALYLQKYIVYVVYFCIKMYRMIKARDCTFLRFYEMTMLLLAGAHIVLMLIGAMSGLVSFNDHFKSLLEALIIYAIWMTYFTKSVRVRTYFGSDAYLKQSFILNLINSRTM